MKSYAQNHINAITNLAKYCGVQKIDAMQILRKLEKIEKYAHNQALDHCIGKIDSDEWDNVCECVQQDVQALFNRELKGFFVNGDPRGYALKLEDSIIGREGEYENICNGIHRDFGGYGILAPEKQ